MKAKITYEVNVAGTGEKKVFETRSSARTWIALLARTFGCRMEVSVKKITEEYIDLKDKSLSVLVNEP